MGNLGCSPTVIRNLEPAQVKSLIDSHRVSDYLLVDVREREEYEAGHIPGAKWLPLGELDARAGQEIPADAKVITYCRSGRRSMAGAILLCGMGFEDIQNLQGGILDWPFETVTGSPEESVSLYDSARETRHVLLTAFRAEQGTWELYHRIRSGTPDERGFLGQLQDLEEQHMKILYKELAKHWEGGAPSIEELKQDTDADFPESGITTDEALLRFEEEPRDSLEYLELAIEIEAKAYDLYSKLAMTGREGDLHQIFNKLATEEREHMKALIQELRQLLPSESPTRAEGS